MRLKHVYRHTRVWSHIIGRQLWLWARVYSCYDTCMQLVEILQLLLFEPVLPSPSWRTALSRGSTSKKRIDHSQTGRAHAQSGTGQRRSLGIQEMERINVQWTLFRNVTISPIATIHAVRCDLNFSSVEKTPPPFSLSEFCFSRVFVRSLRAFPLWRTAMRLEMWLTSRQPRGHIGRAALDHVM